MMSYSVGEGWSASFQNAFFDRLLPFEGLVQRQQLVNEHAKRKTVYFLCVLLFAVVAHDFRRHETFRASKALGSRRQSQSAYTYSSKN